MSLKHAFAVQEKTESTPTGPLIQETVTEPRCGDITGADPLSRMLVNVIDSLASGVLVISNDGRVILANRFASDLLGLTNIKQIERLLPIPCRHPSGCRSVGDSGLQPEYFIFPGPNGRLISCARTPLTGDPGTETEGGHILIMEDITEPVKQGARLERTQTLTAMGEMAAEVAHQVRNPLGGIELVASILRREVAQDENLESLVDQILDGANRINHLITNYLALARPPRPVKGPTRLDQVLEEALSVVSDFLPQKRIYLDIRFSSSSPWVEADRELLLQVFMNILLNAMEAMASGGRLRVDLRFRGRRVEVEVEDTGDGIPENDLDRIFNPFFTTKEKNLGLGLAVSHRIVDAHHGAIQVHSRPGTGTTVILSFPLLSAPGEPSATARS